MSFNFLKTDYRLLKIGLQTALLSLLKKQFL
jgi:hypothetical protein